MPGRRRRSARHRRRRPASPAAQERRPWRRIRRPAPPCRSNGVPRRQACAVPRRKPAAAVILAVLGVGPKIWPTSNKADIAKAARGIGFSRPRSGQAAGSAACRRDRRRSDWPATSSGAPPPKFSACVLADEGPGHGLDHAARGQARRRARARAAATGSARGRRRRRRAPAEPSAMRSRPAMRTISSTRSALPSISGRQLGARTWTSLGIARLPGDGKAELFQSPDHFATSEPQAGQPLDFAEGEGNAGERRPATWPATKSFGRRRRRRAPAPAASPVRSPGRTKAGSTPRSKR